MSPTVPTGPLQPALDKLGAVLGYTFRHQPLLVRALTHSSLAYERAAAERAGTNAQGTTSIDDEDNEQLEFLGDAVVGLLVAEMLCKHCPEYAEGQLTRLRAALVSRRHLGEVAARLHFGEYLRLGRGEERSGGRKKNAILANSIEAVIGAIYLDGGLDTVRLFVEREIVGPSLNGLLREMERGSAIGDHKSALQELLQGRHLGTPQYSVKAESGPDHRKRFVVEVRISGAEPSIRPLASGIGSTKKRAEQEAARHAVEKLRAEGEAASGGVTGAEQAGLVSESENASLEHKA